MNRYCKRLGIPVPDLAVATESDLGLFELMVVALLERGEPMRIEELAERLKEVGVDPPGADLKVSLRKAWHGLDPVIRDPGGRYGLDLTSDRLPSIAFRAAPPPSPSAPPPSPSAPPPSPSAPPPSPSAPPRERDPVEPDDGAPLSPEELDAAFDGRPRRDVLPPLRQAAAVLDVNRRPMTVAEVNAVLAGLTRETGPVSEDRLRWAQSPLVVRGADGCLALGGDPEPVRAMRRAFRKLALPTLRRRVRDACAIAGIAAWQKKSEERLRADEVIAARLRRAVLRVVPDERAPAAAALLDVGERTIHTFLGEEMAELAGELAPYDVLAGLAVRDTLWAIGVDADRFRLADLRPPQKTRVLNRSGRKLAITPELIITGTTGISRPLGDHAGTLGYLRAGEDTKLARRLASDVKSLLALYRYGVLHNCVLLHWGFVHELLGVDWALPGDLGLSRLLHRAQEEGLPVDLVTGTAPGWSDPWSRAQRVTVERVEAEFVELRSLGAPFRIGRYEIQAARIAEPGE